MLTLAITLVNGEHVEIEVQQFEMIRLCRYEKCRAEFRTIDPDQLYCKPSHGVRASELRRLIRELNPA